jgi:uncharacterized protein (TIGR02001 family)
MKKRVLVLGLGALVLPALPAGAAGVEYNLGVVSDYVWRGVSQSDNHAAVQGGVDLKHQSGLYAGAWASTVDFADADVELDLYGGFAFKTRGGWVWDIGLIAYRYDESQYKFEEGYVSLTYGYLSGKVWHDWDNDDTYTEGNATFRMGSGFYTILHGGYYAKDRAENYSDYAVALGREFSDFDARVTLSDTDHDDSIVALSLRTTF